MEEQRRNTRIPDTAPGARLVGPRMFDVWGFRLEQIQSSHTRQPRVALEKQIQADVEDHPVMNNLPVLTDLVWYLLYLLKFPLDSRLLLQLLLLF